MPAAGADPDPAPIGSSPGQAVPGAGGALRRVEERLPDGRRLTRYQRTERTNLTKDTEDTEGTEDLRHLPVTR